MYPFRSILFPTDFSLHAHAALKYAAAFAREGRGRVVLLNVQDAKVPANLVTLPEYVFDDESNKWLLELRTQMKTLLADPLLHGVDAEPVLLEGDPAEKIAQAAVDYEVDLITVATRDRNRLSRAFGGSLAEAVVADSPAAAVVRPPQHDFVEHRGGHQHSSESRVAGWAKLRPSSAAATQPRPESRSNSAPSCTPSTCSETTSNRSRRYFPKAVLPR